MGNNNRLQHMLTSPDKGMTKTSGPNGVLSRLFRTILFDLNIGPAKFGYLLQDYVVDTRHGVPNNRKDQTSMRGNLRKEFAKTQMTWKVFCKSLRFLQIRKMEINVKLFHYHHEPTTHSTTVDFGERRDVQVYFEKLDQAEGQEVVPYNEALDRESNDTSGVQ